MMRGMAGLVGAFAFLFLFSSRLPAQDVIKVRGGPASQVTFIEYSEDGVTVKSGGGKKTYRWEQLDPKCVYDLVRRHMDATSGPAHWALAEYCAAAGMLDEAKSEYRRCREIDLSYRKKVDRATLELETATPAKRKKDLPAPVPEGGTSAAESKTAETDKIPVQPRPRPPAPLEQPGDDAEILAQQRKNGEVANEKVGTSLKTYETPHFILHTDFTSAADLGTIKKWCEAIYDRLTDVLDIQPGEKLWAGKCEAYLFLNRWDFTKFAREVDHFPEAKLSGGYCHRGARACHIAIPRSDYNARDTCLSTLVHEMTHAFVGYHVGRADLRSWLNEGLAEFSELALPKGGAAEREDRWRRVKQLTQKKGFSRFSELRAVKQVLPDDAELYALSWSIVDYMITTDKTHKKFGKFINFIKEGKSEDEAMQEAFAQTPDELEQAWLRYVRARR